MPSTKPPLSFLLSLVALLLPSATASSKPPFWFGVATSSYQIEGGAREGGRGPSIWDTFSHERGRTARGDTGDVAADFYHRYRSDIALARSLGVDKFRLSISWPRIFPNATTRIDAESGELVAERPNEEGLAFYESVLDALEESGVEPIVTLYHWDLPQRLQDEYGGWTSERVVEDFRVYSRTVFERLGRRKGKRRSEPFDDDDESDIDVDVDESKTRITYWTTLNEPWVFCFLGHVVGVHAPGTRSAEKGWACARNALLAHLAAAEEFEEVFGRDDDDVENGRRKKRRRRRPLLSVNIPTQFAVPFSSESPEDVEAARVAMDYDGLGTFADVLFKGQWPPSILYALTRANATSSFVAPPPFSERETARFLRHRPRYFALNFYTSYWARATPSPVVDPQTCLEASFAKAQVREGPGSRNETIGVPGAPSWLYSTPWAMREVLREVSGRYEPLDEIVVTENGFATRAEEGGGGDGGGGKERDVDGAFEDGDRVDFYKGYLSSALDAARVDGIPLTGYCAWSLLDNFEWADGYSKRFGVVKVDYETQEREVKRSALWLRDFFGGGGGGDDDLYRRRSDVE